MLGQQFFSLFLVESNSYDANWWKNIKNLKLGPISQNHNWCLFKGTSIRHPCDKRRATNDPRWYHLLQMRDKPSSHRAMSH